MHHHSRLRPSRNRTISPFVILSVLLCCQFTTNVLLRIWQVVASGNGITFFCKDLLHIWQVFPLGNAACKISRIKCKFFIKKEYFFCLKPLFYSKSWSQSWFMSTLMVIGRMEWEIQSDESDTYSQMTLCYCKMTIRLQ